MGEETKKVEELTLRKVNNGYAIVVGGGIDIYVAKSFEEASQIADEILNPKEEAKVEEVAQEKPATEEAVA